MCHTVCVHRWLVDEHNEKSTFALCWRIFFSINIKNNRLFDKLIFFSIKSRGSWKQILKLIWCSFNFHTKKMRNFLAHDGNIFHVILQTLFYEHFLKHFFQTIFFTRIRLSSLTRYKNAGQKNYIIINELCSLYCVTAKNESKPEKESFTCRGE